MLPVRLLSLIKTSGKIDDYHLGKYFIAMIVTPVRRKDASTDRYNIQIDR